jgi:hypothetical protein
MRFERDMACTEAEWLRWLPDAIGDREWERGEHAVRVRIGEGTLDLSWNEAMPRQIALVRLPRLLVVFEFLGVCDDERHAFMKRFDLYMHRGGG